MKKNVQFQRTNDGGATVTMRIQNASFTVKMSPQELRSIAQDVAAYHKHLHRHDMGANEVAPEPVVYQACALILVRRMKKGYAQAMRKRMAVLRILKKIATKKAKSDASKAGRPVTRGDVKNGMHYAMEKAKKAGIPLDQPDHSFWTQDVRAIIEKITASIMGYHRPGHIGGSGGSGGTTADLIKQGSPASQLMIMKAIQEARAKKQFTKQYLDRLKTIEAMPGGPKKDALLQKFKAEIAHKMAAHEKANQIAATTKHTDKIVAVARRAQALKDAKVKEARDAVRSVASAKGQPPLVQIALKEKAKEAIEEAKKADKTAKRAAIVAKFAQAPLIKKKSELFRPYPLRHPGFN